MFAGTFPSRRMRRLRNLKRIREAVADTLIPEKCLIYPIFVGDLDQPRPVDSMPGVAQLPVEVAVEVIQQLAAGGLRQFLLFGITPAAKKDPTGSFARASLAPVNRTLRAVRQCDLDVVLYADLCLCEYTDHGHCGTLSESAEAEAGTSVSVTNDPTLGLLGPMAVALAKSGADVIAPSGMMDGQVGAIRAALDDAGFVDTLILSYCIKYASNLYGPFRDAGEGGMKCGDRKSYQMDYRRTREWRSELQLDLSEGADMVMVKPAVTCLDIVHQVRHACDIPLAAFHVSGEYAMLHAAAERGWVDLQQAALEQTYAIRRAGADLIVTYFAPQLIQWLAQEDHEG